MYLTETRDFFPPSNPYGAVESDLYLHYYVGDKDKFDRVFLHQFPSDEKLRCTNNNYTNDVMLRLMYMKV